MVGFVLREGDCLDVLPTFPAGIADMVLTDVPYGTTACKWDEVIPFAPMWSALRKIAKPNAAIVMTASQPFTSALIMSNPKAFRYEWIWEKSRCTGFLQSKFMPMKGHENVLVFCFGGVPTYNPQKTFGHPPTNSAKGYGHSPTFGASKERNYKGGDTSRYPKSIQYFKSERGLHPVQKPVALAEYLIKTYTDLGQVVLDFCIGSGSFGVGCANTGRRFIGIEKDPKVFGPAKIRIQKAYDRISRER